eukprot:gene16043-11482_t
MVDSLDWVQVSDDDNDDEVDEEDVDEAHSDRTGKVARIVQEKERIISSLSRASSSSAMLARGDAAGSKGIRSSASTTDALPPVKSSSSHLRRSFRQPPQDTSSSSPTKRPIDWAAVSHRHNFVEQNKHNVVLLNHAMKLLSKEETSSSFVKASLRRAILQEGPSLNPSLSPLVSPTETAVAPAATSSSAMDVGLSSVHDEPAIDSAPVANGTPTKGGASSSALPPVLQLPPYPSSLPPSRRPSDASLVSLASAATTSSVVTSPTADKPPSAAKGKRSVGAMERPFATPTSSQPSSTASTPRRGIPSAKPTPSPSSASKPLAARSPAATTAATASAVATPSSHHHKPPAKQPRTPPTPPVKTPLGKIRHHGKIDFILENKIEVKRTSDSVHYLRTVASSTAATASAAAGTAILTPVIHRATLAAIKREISHDTRQEFLQLVHHSATANGTGHPSATSVAGGAASHHQSQQHLLGERTASAQQLLLTTDYDPKKIRAVAERAQSMFETPTKPTTAASPPMASRSAAKLMLLADEEAQQAPPRGAIDVAPLELADTVPTASATAPLIDETNPMHAAAATGTAAPTPPTTSSPTSRHPSSSQLTTTSTTKKPLASSTSSFLEASTDVFTAEVQRSMRPSQSRQAILGHNSSVASSHRRSFSLGPASPAPPAPLPPSSRPTTESETEDAPPSGLIRKPSALSAAFFADVVPVTTVASCDGLDDDDEDDHVGGAPRGALDVVASCGASFDENENEDDDKPFRLVGVSLTPTWDRMKKHLAPAAAAAVDGDGDSNGRMLPPPPPLPLLSSSSTLTVGELDGSSGHEIGGASSFTAGQPVSAAGSLLTHAAPGDTDTDVAHEHAHAHRPPQKRPSIFASWTSASTDDA